MAWKDSVEGLQKSALAHFSEPFSYQPPTGPAVTVQGIFRDCGEPVSGPGDVEMISIQPRLDVKRSLLPGGLEPRARVGTWTRVSDGQVYQIEAPEPDGEGMLTMRLHAFPPK